MDADCNCRKCREDRGQQKAVGHDGVLWELGREVIFIVCSICGNKRCPKATDHTLACTDSNDPGQPGSIFQ